MFQFFLRNDSPSKDRSVVWNCGVFLVQLDGAVAVEEVVVARRAVQGSREIRRGFLRHTSISVHKQLIFLGFLHRGFLKALTTPARPHNEGDDDDGNGDEEDDCGRRH